MRYPEPAHNPMVPVPLSSQQPDKEALRVPVSMYNDSMVEIEVPELTPPGAPMTVIRGATLAAAEKRRDEAVARFLSMGLPHRQEDEKRTAQALKAARSRWSAIGVHR